MMQSSDSAADQLPWHNVTVEVKDLATGAPARFRSIRVETRRAASPAPQWLGSQDYDPERDGFYTFQYRLKNPNATIWLTVVSDDGEVSKPITQGKHRYRFGIGSPHAERRPEGSANPEDPGQLPRQTTINYTYNIADNSVKMEGVKMAVSKYEVRGNKNTLVGERADISGSFNKGSQVVLAPAVEKAFTEAAGFVKQANDKVAQKAVRDLKREAKKKVPDKSKMKGLWDGVVKATPGIVKAVGPTTVRALQGLFS